VEVLQEGGAVFLSHIMVAEDGEDGNLLDEIPVRREEATVVVSLLTDRIDHVAGVKDKVRLEAFQQPGDHPLSLAPTSTVVDHGEGKARVLADRGGAEAARQPRPDSAYHPIVVG
jgi:hypothetical protein